MVSKNAGGTKRVTSLADALKLNFGLVTTQPRRQNNMSASMEGSSFFDKYGEPGTVISYDGPNDSIPNPDVDDHRTSLTRLPLRPPPQSHGTPTSHPRHMKQTFTPLVLYISPPSGTLPLRRLRERPSHKKVDRMARLDQQNQVAKKRRMSTQTKEQEK